MDRTLVEDLATAEGVCIRPLLRRLVDRESGEARTVVLPCGSTRESRCPSCAKRARSLRMHQCAEGWHLQEEVPDREQTDDPDEEADEDQEGEEEGTDQDASSRRVRSTKRRQDATDLPVRPIERRTVGTTFPGNDGQVFRPSMFTTLTIPSYGKVIPGVGVPLDPARLTTGGQHWTRSTSPSSSTGGCRTFAGAPATRSSTSRPSNPKGDWPPTCMPRCAEASNER